MIESFDKQNLSGNIVHNNNDMKGWRNITTLGDSTTFKLASSIGLRSTRLYFSGKLLDWISTEDKFLCSFTNFASASVPSSCISDWIFIIPNLQCFQGEKKLSSVTRPARELFYLCVEHLPDIFSSVRPSHCIFQSGLGPGAFRNIFPVTALFQLKLFLICSDHNTLYLIASLDWLIRWRMLEIILLSGFRLVLANLNAIDKLFRLKIRFVSSKNFQWLRATERLVQSLPGLGRTFIILSSPSYSILKFERTYQLFNQCNPYSETFFIWLTMHSDLNCHFRNIFSFKLWLLTDNQELNVRHDKATVPCWYSWLYASKQRLGCANILL